ncbi:hypothetical protein [Paraglaciecola sp. L3A3]|uniref:hypothetical protein n=1 Tax=Paraglaciecola sp. L3A3 TaxID=2686358 RepID=UPI00131D061C|nr:hypothetical protein [Paraglaciecola sp. L3A3]
MNKQFKIALFTAVSVVICSTHALAKVEDDPMQVIKKQQLEQVKKSKAQRKLQIEERKTIRREKAVEKIKLRAIK